MSFILRSLRPMTATHSIIKPAIVSKPFSASTILALKEGNAHTPEQAAEYEAHKQDLLQKQKDGKGHWKPELASHSEEAVMADRTAVGKGVKELQDETKGHAEEKSRAGTSQGSGF